MRGAATRGTATSGTAVSGVATRGTVMRTVAAVCVAACASAPAALLLPTLAHAEVTAVRAQGVMWLQGGAHAPARTVVSMPARAVAGLRGIAVAGDRARARADDDSRGDGHEGGRDDGRYAGRYDGRYDSRDDSRDDSRYDARYGGRHDGDDAGDTLAAAVPFVGLPGALGLRGLFAATAPAPRTGDMLRTVLPFVTQAASDNRLDPALLLAVIHAESGFNPAALSPKGAVGLMQLMPATAGRYGEPDPRDPARNVRAGAAHLRYLIARYGDLALALAAYNAGEGAVERHGLQIPPYAETQQYVPRVMALYRGYQARIPETVNP